MEGIEGGVIEYFATLGHRIRDCRKATDSCLDV